MLRPEELNYIIFRYLLEAGYVHAAYMFSHESGVASAGVPDTLVPVGTLVSLLNKGLLLLDIEAHMDAAGRLHICEHPPSLFEPHRCTADTLGFTENSPDELSGPTAQGVIGIAGAGGQAVASALRERRSGDPATCRVAVPQDETQPLALSESLLTLSGDVPALTPAETRYMHELIDRVFQSASFAGTNAGAGTGSRSASVVPGSTSLRPATPTESARVVSQDLFERERQGLRRELFLSSIGYSYYDSGAALGGILASAPLTSLADEPRLLIVTPTALIHISGTGTGAGKAPAVHGVPHHLLCEGVTEAVASTIHQHGEASIVATSFTDGRLYIADVGPDMVIAIRYMGYPVGQTTARALEFNPSGTALLILGTVGLPAVFIIETCRSVTPRLRDASGIKLAENLRLLEGATSPLAGYTMTGADASLTCVTWLDDQLFCVLHGQRMIYLAGLRGEDGAPLVVVDKDEDKDDLGTNTAVADVRAACCYTVYSHIHAEEPLVAIAATQISGRSLGALSSSGCLLRFEVKDPRSERLEFVLRHTHRLSKAPLHRIYAYPRTTVVTSSRGEIYTLNNTTADVIAWHTCLDAPIACLARGTDETLLVGLENGAIHVLDSSGAQTFSHNVFHRACAEVAAGATFLILSDNGALCVITFEAADSLLQCLTPS